MAELGNTGSGNTTYITPFDGRFAQRVPEGTEGATSRTLTRGDNAGKLVWEKYYGNVTGTITAGDVAVKSFDGKKVQEIQVTLDGEITLQLPMNLLSMFAKPLPNVDITQPVMISIYKNKAGKIGLQITQGNDFRDKCDWAYTRESPNGLPAAVKDDIGNWDFRDHDRFLIEKVNEFFSSLPKGADKPETQQPASAPAEGGEPPDTNIYDDYDEDDVPF